MNIIYYRTFSGRMPEKEYVYSLPKADIEGAQRGHVDLAFKRMKEVLS
jgi:hypothetical protein